MRLRLNELGGSSVLAGASNGVTALARLVSELRADSSTEPLVLDFEGVDVATVSFLRECVLAFRDYCLGRDRPVAPVVANANDAVREELEVALRTSADALVACDIGADDQIRNARVLGELEPKQRVTLEAVIDAGQADARMLLERFSDQEKIGITGWNNRLAALAAKGILLEDRQGRSKHYRPVLEDLRCGS